MSSSAFALAWVAEYRDEAFKHQLQSLIGEVSDDGILALRQLMSDRFGFDLGDKAARDAVTSLALENCFNPVCALIDKAEAEWDGVKRLDRMAADYFNCEDTPLNSAFMRKMMIGLIKRAREPGCKFDTIVVLESKEGFNKSTAWCVLAGAENFSDERILGKEAREVQEQLSEVWIHENADLARTTPRRPSRLAGTKLPNTGWAYRVAPDRQLAAQPGHGSALTTSGAVLLPSIFLLSRHRVAAHRGRRGVVSERPRGIQSRHKA